jgi:hypothetical protein
MRWRFTLCKRPEYGKMRMRCTWRGSAKKVAAAEEGCGWVNARLRADPRHAACIDEKKTANTKASKMATFVQLHDPFFLFNL